MWRKITESPYYFAEPFNRFQAWFDLLITANHNIGYIYKRGIKITLNRGQVGYDLDTLASRWKWSRGKVERYMIDLEKDNQIIRQKTNVTTLISIVNYELYQKSSKADDNVNNNSDESKIINQSDTNNNDKKKKKERIMPEWAINFEVYLQELRTEYVRLINDKDFIKSCQDLHKGLDIIKTLENNCVSYWATEEGWKNKKNSKTIKINWAATLKRSLNFKDNRIWLPK